jgi:hypothetical protein
VNARAAGSVGVSTVAPLRSSWIPNGTADVGLSAEAIDSATSVCRAQQPNE